MERKVPPPRGFGGPPVAAQPLAHRNGPPIAFTASAPNAPPPPPQQPTAPQSFGFPAVNTSNRRNWRPGRVGGRHDSPLYGKHRKRPSSSSIDSNVSWSGSEIESVGGYGPAHSEPEQVTRLSWASSVTAREEAPASAVQQDLAPAASLFGASSAEQTPRPAVSAELETKHEAAVQPPKTPLGKPTLDEDGGISAAQRVRMELSGNRVGSRANSSENVFVNNPPGYDEEKNGPQSCPSTFNNAREPQFSIDKLRQMRSNELVASKLLPTRASVNSLMGYVRELQMSEASLRKQLVKTKQHTEEELTHSLSKVSELERSMQEVERDRELARRKMEEQEQLIRDLATKLKQAEAAKAKGSSASAVDELPSIAEESTQQTEAKTRVTTNKEQKPEAGVTPQVPVPPMQPPLPRHPEQLKDSNRSAQFGLASPRSPNRPLWDPWASGGATPMKNLPPVFNIGSTGLDPMAASSTTAAQTSTTDSMTTAAGDYELKSVLMSPRRVQESGGPAQQSKQNEATAPALAQVDFAPQYPAPIFNVGAMPSPSYPQQPEFVSSEPQDLQHHEEVPLMESPSQAVPMLPVEPMPPADGHEYEHQVGVTGNVTYSNGTEWNGPQHQGQTPEASYPSPLATNMDSNEAIAPPPSTIIAEGPTVLPAQDPIEKSPPQVVAPPYNGRVPNTEADQVSNPDAYNAAANVGSAPPVGTSVPPPSTSEAQPPPCPASATQKDAKPAPAEPVTLEALLVDFFTEVDKKRLKMAKAYGKRYAGREKWLFAELTKRYGAAKVGALKARFENGSTGGAPTTTTTSSSNGDAAAVTDTDTDNHATKAPETSDHSKTGRQGHPRHPQFFHPPAPAANVDLSAGMSSVPPPLTTPQANDASDSQTEGAEGPPSLSGNASPGRAARVSPRQRRSGGNIPPYSGPPPSFPLPQEANEGNNVGAVAAGTPLTNASPAPTQRDESMSQPPPPPSGMDNNNTASLGLRQRHNSSGPGAPRQKNTDAEAPAVTLEGLLKELYKKHQPDKLKNAPIVAKQYAGKERELVGLLKGKYGALSVKRLEENVEVLERAHRARTGGKSSGKKRGCFVRTISLVFWLSVLLYFSFGAVFVSFVVLDAWGCRSDEQEAESSEECLPLKKELETFTYEHVGDYVSQSHPDACFCLEWKARETALFTNLSGDDFVNLARLVPFSPESYGDPWIATVKEQVPSQEFYDSYAKPVVDLSLDVGFFVWSSALELAGYADVSEEKSPVVLKAVENETFDVLLLDEESDSDVLTGSQERAAEEEENESFLSEMNVDELLNQDTDAKADAVVDAPEQALVEEESEKLADEVEIEEVDAATQDGASVAENDEDAVVLVEVEEATPTEDSNSASSEIKNEEHATLDESVEGVLPVDESESVEVSEDDSAVLKETDTETKEVLFEDDSVSFPVEDVESVGDENDGPTSSPEDVTETPDADNSVDVTDEVPGQVEEEDAEKVAASIEEESDVESEEVVEVEVRQEGLDLTYPETEADADATEVQETDVVEVPSLASDEDLESTLSGDGEVSAPSSEVVETDTVSSELEVDDLAMDALEEDSESEVNVAEEDSTTFVDADADTDAETVESESDVGASIVVPEEEDVDESEASLEENTVSEESESVEEEVDSAASTPTEFEVEVLETESEEVSAGLVSQEPDAEVSELEADISSEAEAEKEALSEAEETLAEDNHTDELDEESITMEDEIELTFSSSADVEELLPGESAVNEEAVVSEKDSDDEEEESSTDAEVPGDDDDSSALAAEIEAEIPDLELEEEVASVPSEQVQEQTGDAEIEALELEEESAEKAAAALFEANAVETKDDGAEAEADDLDAHAEALELEEESAEDAVTTPVDVEAVEAKDEEAETEASELAAPSDAKVESLEDGVEEDGAEQPESESEDGVSVELVEESVATEVTEVSDDVGVITTEPDEHVEGPETTDAPSTDREAADEETIVVDDELTNEAEQETNEIEEETNEAEGLTYGAVVDEDSRVAETEETLAASDETAPVADEEAESNVEEVPAADDGVEYAEKASNADGESGVVEDETTEPQQVAGEVPPPEEMESGGLASAVNEVLARLVEPFEAAKTAMPTEAEHVVDEL
ncbi:uncharacterized protein KRP23_13223 [Phytophthora ramorum]|uniref:uncharacterized protein n=1 Tax=Phytophthora ramorum TaxID=164328 RepID=UPI0030A4B9FB|nr:hypothetical protein KRP23_13223 [Phytophthora ramorum]